jgi:tRNA-dihydrouridine synthase B
MLKIGNLKLSLPLVLAPMAGVSDLPFRLITRPFGVPIAFTEMIDVNSLCHKDKRTLRMISSVPEDRPLGIQLLGNDREQILKSLDALDGYEFDVIDFNAACPASKVVRKGKGAALLREPRRLKELLDILVKHSKVPVTVKIRTGWDDCSINAREVALMAEDAGISALFIHGRTKAQGYSGKVDYRSIKEVKKALKIPVIASGDNTSVPLIKNMFDETGCDGAAVARGSLGNPWIFREIIRFFSDGVFSGMPDVQERIDVMKAHLNLAVQYWGERRGVASFHKFFIWYTRGMHGIKELRDSAFRTKNTKELLDAIEALGAVKK